jgi:two-component system, OmpR family, sensor kinase
MPRRPHTSIRRRITVATGLLAVLAILLTSGLAVVVAQVYLGKRTAADLEARVHHLSALVDEAADRTIPLQRVEDLLRTGDTVENGNGIVFASDGAVVASFGVSTGDARMLAATTRILTADTVPDVERTEASTLVLPAGRLTVGVEGRSIEVERIVVTTSTAQRSESVRLIALVNSIGSAVGIAVVLVFVSITVGRGLRPLRDMAARAAAVARGDHTARLPIDVNDPAIEQLSVTVNAAFDAQQDAENRMRAFVADAGHELRTPLTVATGWIDLYAQGGLTDPERLDVALDRVRVQLGRMRAMADELALLANADAGRSFAHEPVDLTALVREVVEDARVAAPGRTIALSASGPAQTTGDEARLAQVFRNLVGNALQHTTPDVLVSVEVAAEGDETIVVVADQGAGIDEQDLPHVFERFWRSDAARQRVTGGSGLGLAIVHSIIAAHGGSIGVQSRRDEGTAFRVLLPRRVDHRGDAST